VSKAPVTVAQAVQTSAAPAPFFQNPAAQATTALSVAEVQVNAVPVKELVTAVQAVQTFAVPVVTLKKPAAQATTALSVADVQVNTVPAKELVTAVQAVQLATLEAAENVPAAQAVHVVPEPLVPVSVINCAAQLVQPALFPATAYFATAHAVQVAVSSPLPAVQVLSAVEDVHVAASVLQAVQSTDPSEAPKVAPEHAVQEESAIVVPATKRAVEPPVVVLPVHAPMTV